LRRAAVFLKVLEAMLAEYVERGNLQILTEHYPVAADTEKTKVRSVALVNLRSGENVSVSAGYFIDATELGELLPLTKTEFVTGAESKTKPASRARKRRASRRTRRRFSVCYAMSFHAGEITRLRSRKNYEFWRDYMPNLSPPWSGKLLSLDGINPRLMQPISYNFAPHQEPNRAFAGLWTYRRILHRENFRRKGI
jgi:hypothetical protein